MVEENKKKDHANDIWNYIRRVDHDVAELKVSVGGIASTVAGQGAQLDRIEAYISRPNPTNWGWLISAVGLFLMIGGIAVAVLKSEIARLEEYQGIGALDYLEHVRDGHPHRVEQKVEQLREAMNIELRNLHKEVDKNTAHLASRDGKLFNKIDGDQLERNLKEYVDERTKNRFTSQEGRALDERLKQVEAEQRRRSTSGNWKE